MNDDGVFSFIILFEFFEVFTCHSSNRKYKCYSNVTGNVFFFFTPPLNYMHFLNISMCQLHILYNVPVFHFADFSFVFYSDIKNNNQYYAIYIFTTVPCTLSIRQHQYIHFIFHNYNFLLINQTLKKIKFAIGSNSLGSNNKITVTIKIKYT